MKINLGQSPLIVTAIHNGHAVRPEVLPYMNLTEEQRLREEDPYTTEWLEISDSTIQVMKSRFEVDINRQREKAIYLKPDDAWGLDIWNKPLPDDIVQGSRDIYDQFYERLKEALDKFLDKHPWAIVYDMHSYNFRREGPDQFDDPDANPEINIGTANCNREHWGPVIDQLLHCMRDFNFEGRYLDVRENVKFGGGYFSHWLHETYGDRICPIAIEVKKFFMDEWTGEVNEGHVRHIREMLIDTIHPVLEQAESLNQPHNAG
jgi:N-formylglutamate amidohydrolase